MLLAREPFEFSSSGDGQQTSALGSKEGGEWYAGVFGALSNVTFRLSSLLYKESFLRPNKWFTAVLQQAGDWRFFEIDLSAIRVQSSLQTAAQDARMERVLKPKLQLK